ncbi:MAG: cobyric acid synthase CobQ [Candidatus Solincola sediminis]|uniref:Cobyric acid synthase n=1 Tax=Candidatus Solincola sediminis TaxID=1797199 RepID=A0A1F2WQA2_9ACTN|nr:MAG: cobyric acid synthase CobQ [Candidatus Solincola sediminis]OFW61507.1 MAG: cobyric acid synthase CobQ [Candidatus Solincola sediminis]
MVQGTGSHTGKSIMTAALCRILRQDGWRVAPFKSQNMSLNSYVTPEGGEMGRAQVLQAQAAGIEPHTDMNPILLKPASDERAQVVLNGRPVGHLGAREYHDLKLEYLPHAVAALNRLRANYQIVVIEGAGSPAEINLKDQDIANMRMAEAAQAPVLLVGDIDRGGVLASLVGTLELLDPGERTLVAGFIINKFRGSLDLLQGALDFLEERTGKPVLGVVPYIRDIGLEEEDSVNLEELRASAGRLGDKAEIDIAVIHLPHISNATDFDPLAHEDGVLLRYVSQPAGLRVPDAVLIPGSKSTCDDLDYMRGSGMAQALLRLAHAGVPVIGICGGYQMLGTRIEDPDGWERRGAAMEGLGLLPVSTVMTGDKSTHRVEAYATSSIPALGLESGSPIEGYEIHMGNSVSESDYSLAIFSRDGVAVSIPDGAFNPALPVFGCYLHGLFENSCVREGFINSLRKRRGLQSLESAGRDWQEWREDRLDRLAAITRSSLEMDHIYSLLYTS